MTAQLSADPNPWARIRAVHVWRRSSWRWWLDGMELDLGAVWTTWVEAHEGDRHEALGHLLLVLDRARLLDDTRRSA